MTNQQNKKQKQIGAIMVLIIVFTAVFFTLIAGILSLIVYQKKFFKLRYAEESALQIAEAGIEYYRWHLAHDENDYSDGNSQMCTPTCGPYDHSYKNNDDTPIGTFRLLITPPPAGSGSDSTLVTINSTGWLTANPNQTRTIEIKYEKLPLTRYAILSNSYLSMPTSSITNGPVHSNKGIRFDGIAYNLVTSALSEDNGDTVHTTTMEYGVHTHKTTDDPVPPTTPPSRPDVFTAGRSFPVAEIDFIALNTVLSDLLEVADSDTSCDIREYSNYNSCNISNTSQRCVIPASGKKGWHIQLLDNDYFKYKKVNDDGECEIVMGPIEIEYTTGKVSYYGSCDWITKPLPSNGVLFVKDNVWIDGIIGANKRVTIVAAKEPFSSGSADIWINNNLTYHTTTGAEAIGLIAQNNISVGLDSADNLIIHGALIAKNGRIGRDTYDPTCPTDGAKYQRNSITINGSLITNEKYVFLHDGGEGYQNQDITYDGNLYDNPPPYFPTEADYSITSWEEK